MATIEQNNKLKIDINKNLEKIISFKIENLTREQDLGALLSFKEIEYLFIKIIDLFKKVNEVDLEEIPYSILNLFNTQLTNAISIFNQAVNFNTNQVNPVLARDGIITSIKKNYDNYLTHSIPILTIGLLNNNDTSIERSKIKALLSEFEADREQNKIKIDKKLNELNEILTNAKSVANQIGVSKHSTVFKTESEFHNIESEKWLKYTILILIGIVISSIFLAFLGKCFTDNTTQVIQFSITKVIFLSALFYALSLTNRNYKAHKHNSIINKHRQNALTTFETFSEAAGDDIQTKNAVLLETTHTIFSNKQTGYMQNESDSDSPNKIIEIFKNVSKNE